MKKVFSSYNFFLIFTILVSLFAVLPVFGKSLVATLWGMGALVIAVVGYKRYTRKSLVVLIAFVSLYVFYLLSVLYSTDKALAGEHLFRRLPLFLFPLLWFFIPETIQPKHKKLVINIFTYSLIAFFTGVITYLLLIGFAKDVAITTLPAVVIRHKIDEFTWLHPAYSSLFLAFAFTNILNASIEKWKQYRMFRKLLAILFMFLVFIFMMLLSAKMSIMALLFVAPVILILRSKNKIKAVLSMAVFVVFIISVIVALPNTRYRFGNMVKALTTKESNDKNPDIVRKNIYSSTFAVIADNPVFGVGLGDVDAELQKQYLVDNHKKALEDKFNTHNQYLEIWLSGGILALLCFIFSLCVGVLLAVINKDYYYLAFLILSSLTLLTENIISRQSGVLFFAFFNSFFAFSYGRSDKKYINGRFLTHRLTGVQRFAFEISKELKKKADTVLVAPANINSRYLKSEVRATVLPLLRGHIWEQITLPFYLSLKGNPLLINLCNTAPLLYCNKVVTVHDLAFEHNPAWFSNNMVRFYKFLIPRICKKSSRIFTVSEFSKSEIIKYYGIDSDKITVVYNALPSDFDVNKEFDNPGLGNYILTVGSIEPRKNIDNIIKAFNLIDNKELKLVIAGGFNKNIFNESGISEHLNNRIIVFENPDDNKLASLYKYAKVFVYTPHYEGFGIPILEAMSFECPCVISDIPVFREVYNNAAYFVNKDDVSNIAAGICEVMVSKSYIDHNERKNMQQFSYFRSASLYS